MVDQSPLRNGDPSREHYEPGLLRYRFRADPEQLPEHAALYVEEHNDRLERALNEIWLPTNGPNYPPILPATLTDWHTHLLTDIEPAERIGRFRRFGERSVYEVWEETDGKPRRCVRDGITVPGIGDQTIHERVLDVCQTFHASRANLSDGPSRVADAVKACAELYVALLKARPFLIDNDPITYMTLHAAYRRVGLEPLIYTPRMPEEGPNVEMDERARQNLLFNHAVARSLQPNNASPEPLVSFLATHAKPR
jgi:hypothetical protein